MPLHPPHPAILDSVSQIQTLVLGVAPAMSAATLQISAASAAGLALQNAVFHQHLDLGQRQVASLQGARAVYQGSAAAPGRHRNSAKKAARSKRRGAIADLLAIRAAAAQWQGSQRR